MNRKNLIALVALFAILVATTYLPAQFLADGNVVAVSWDSAAPKAGELGLKGSASSSVIVGVALDGADNTAGTRMLRTNGLFRLNVYPRISVSTGAAIVVGDTIYGSFADIDDGRSTLSKATDGVPIGYALSAADAATGTTSAIQVLIK